MDTMLSLILLVSEMLQIPRTKVEAHILKKLAFVTKKCLAQDTFGKCQRQKKTFQNKQQYANNYGHKFSCFVYSAKLF